MIRRVFFAVAVLVCALAACQSSGQEGGSVSGNRAEDVAREDFDASVPTPWPASAPEELLPRAVEDYQSDIFVESETFLQECMGQAGFDYEPHDPVSAGFQRIPSEAYDLSDEEFVSKYGWGYSTLLHEPQVFSPEDDPNLETYEGLDAADKEKWDGSLAECSQVLEVANGAVTSHILQMRSEQQIGFSIYSEDPRVGAEYERWSSCIADEGITGYSVPLEVEEEIRSEVNVAWGAAVQAEGEITTVDDITGTPEYQAIIDREKAIAEASLACDFPPPILQRNETLTPILLESLQQGITRFAEDNLGS